jgi:Tfp pilus assembly protein PilV
VFDPTRHLTWSSRSPGHRRDAGFGLVEVLVSVVLLGTVGAAVLASVAAAAVGASTQRDVAAAQTAVSAAADDLAADSTAFVPCATPEDYDSLLVSHDVSVERVDFWNSSVWTPTADAACDPTTNTLQLVTVSAAHRRGALEVQVAKRLVTDPDAQFVVNQGSGSGNGAPVGPAQMTPGIDGPPATTTTTAPVTTTAPTTTTTTAPPATPTTTTAAGTTSTTTVPPPTTTSSTTTTVPATTTTLPGPVPTCAVTSIDVNKWWMDTIKVRVTNTSSRTYQPGQWFVRVAYAGSGAEQNGHFTSTWSDGQLTLTPAQSWVDLRPGTRDITVLEPGGTLTGVQKSQITCQVVTS